MAHPIAQWCIRRRSNDLPISIADAAIVRREQNESFLSEVEVVECFQNAANQRQHAFGASGSGRINDLSNSAAAISFIAHLPGERFITPPGLDLSPLLTQGNAVLLAWEPNYSPIKPINLFPTRRSHKDTLWRISAPVAMTSSP